MVATESTGRGRDILYRSATTDCHADRARIAFFHASWSRGSPGWLTSANRTVPSLSIRKVPRLAIPAFSLNTP
ncbi:hypothetical protein DFQ14_11076 [Halopolyspora algeriensis]|uniref:Uncharacterized protein n=1 Tax=Halopolyspora algeriensis TaxID=1500506 RepID=A0A368VHP0_9ACTN|nr:hypothetical protein DFQ14_11076 [Halopolyspora algeriensis]TQM53331.1 hypothetical protein FHU43_2721 [Halopolyspora algeriensis]